MTYPSSSDAAGHAPLREILETLTAEGHLSTPDLDALCVRLSAAGVTVPAAPTAPLDLSGLASLTFPEIPEDSPLDPLAVISAACASYVMNLIATQGHSRSGPLSLGLALADELVLLPRHGHDHRQLHLLGTVADLLPGAHRQPATDQELLVRSTRIGDEPTVLVLCASGLAALHVHRKLELPEDARFRAVFARELQEQIVREVEHMSTDQGHAPDPRGHSSVKVEA